MGTSVPCCPPISKMTGYPHPKSTHSGGFCRIPAIKEVLNVSAFAMHFFICSLWISVITGLLLGAKYMLRRHLSCRMQYAFRLPVFLLLAMPFFSFRPANPIGLLPIFELWKQKTAAGITSSFPTSPIESGLNTTHWMNDFAVSSGHPTASA